jgi:uncharacterized protein involved in exopolysaccharide biosynthesis
MKIIVTAIVASFLLAGGVGLILSATQKPVYQVQAFPTVRLDDPGHNLVGPDWSGLNRVNETSTEVSRVNEARN